jgi:hypothetical protein
MESVYVLQQNCHEYYKYESWDHRLISISETPEKAWKELKKAVKASNYYHVYEADIESWVKEVEKEGLPLDMMAWDESDFDPDYREFSWHVIKREVLKDEEETKQKNAQKEKKKKKSKNVTKKKTKKVTKKKKNLTKKKTKRKNYFVNIDKEIEKLHNETKEKSADKHKKDKKIKEKS